MRRETFRDIKDIRFGLGRSATHIGDCRGRDRLLFLCAIAQMLLTLLGAAGEKAGIDKYLKGNTSKSVRSREVRALAVAARCQRNAGHEDEIG